MSLGMVTLGLISSNVNVEIIRYNQIINGELKKTLSEISGQIVDKLILTGEIKCINNF